MVDTRISRRRFLKGSLTWASAATLGGLTVSRNAQSATSSAAPRAAKPNFLVIVADDMGFSDIGCYGGEIATPNLDRLAAGGVRFTQGYSTGRCWPSRTCLLTGYYPQQVRMDPPQGPLPAWTRVAPHYLKPLGYRCYTSGKWHLMGAPKPVADGAFDRSYVLHDHNRYFTPANHELDDQKLPAVKDGEKFYVTTAIAQHMLDFLTEHAAQHRSRPFYSYLAFTSPHFPLHALPEDIARYRDRYLEGWDAVRERRWRRLRELGIVNCDLPPLETTFTPRYFQEEFLQALGPGEVKHPAPWASLTGEQKRFQATKMAIHAAMVDRMDREIGRVLDQVRAMGAEENTVVVFVSDNGADATILVRGDGHDRAVPPGSGASFLCIGPGWASASNAPFRRHKIWSHEGGIASPLIVHWPAGIRARGELRHAAVHFIDVLPTLFELAGAGAISPAWNGVAAPPLPGRSLVGALERDIAMPRDYLFFCHEGNRALRQGDWKLVSAREDNDVWELHDLKTDRCEMKNLAEKHPDKVREMSARWQALHDEFRQQAGPPPAGAKKAAKPAKTKKAKP